MIFPVPVSRNRFAVPLCVFIFGMVAVVSVSVPAAVHAVLAAAKTVFAVTLCHGASWWHRP
jgi:hypothetical protein